MKSKSTKPVFLTSIFNIYEPEPTLPFVLKMLKWPAIITAGSLILYFLVKYNIINVASIHLW